MRPAVPPLRLAAVAPGGLSAGLEAVRAALSGAPGVWVEGQRLYSDLLGVWTLDIEAGAGPGLRVAGEAAGLRFDAGAAPEAAEWAGAATLAVRFAGGSGARVHPVPAVPG